MAMTNDNQAPKVAANPVVKPHDAIRNLTPEQLKAAASAAAAIKAQGQDQDEALIGVSEETKQQLKDEAFAEKTGAAKPKKPLNTVSVADLCEDDAYNLSVYIAAKASYSADFLKVVLKDRNYIARWCNLNHIRQSMLIAQGFRHVSADEVDNMEGLKMFLDVTGRFVYSDLVLMKMRKDEYYGAIRNNYVKSLYATDNRKAMKRGAAWATENLGHSLSAPERTYMEQHQEQHADKPVYNPSVGV